MKRLFAIIALMLTGTAFSAPESAIIPTPASAVFNEGTYTLKNLAVYIEDKDIAQDLTEMLTLKMSPATGWNVTESKESSASVRFIKEPSLKDENYTLTIDSKGVTCRASGYAGHFYALQTLLQLLPPEICSKEVRSAEWTLPFVQIEDGPRFSWRGMMLDVSRHWFTKEEVKKYIDEISAYKMNIFHWHLTDDQGWRIQIDSYPRLTEVGAWRARRVGQWWQREPQREGEIADYGGYYTKEDIKEVVEYARKRNVDIMPEVDVPGHSLAALVAYPELACLKAPSSVNVGNKFYGIDENALCAGNDASIRLMDSVIREVSQLFPFGYIHMGGDECYKGFWEKCPKCQARIEHEHLDGVNGLQSWFMQKMENIIKKYGKRMVGWDEILEGGLAEDATVMSWRGIKGGVSAAKAGHSVIMTPTTNCYLDLYQGEPSAEPDTYSMLRLSSCYSFEPVPDSVDGSLILGGQGNLWAESVPTFHHAEYMAWPRGWALSESLWSNPKNKNWTDFVRRTELHFARAEAAGINHSDKSMYNAIIDLSLKDSELVISLASEIPDVKMHYTFDNTIPDCETPLYSKPLTVPKDATWLKVQSYRNGHKVGSMLTFPIKDLKEKAAKKK